MKLTPREAEALAMTILEGNPRMRYNGTVIGQGPAGSGTTKVVDRIRDLKLIDGIVNAGTVKGVDIMNEPRNLALVPPAHRERLEHCSANDRLIALEREATRRYNSDERARIGRETRQRALEKRNAAIPARIDEIAGEHGIIITDNPDEELSEIEFAERLVNLWNAIVDADAAL